MADMDDFNQKIIDEFRSNDGRVGGPFEGATVILVHHKGRKSGTERVNPLVTQPVGGGWAIFGSKGGAPTAPDWYHNLKANPQTTAEVATPDGIAVHEVTAREAEGDERDEIWERQKANAPGFAEYETKAGRVIPVVILEPTS
jgi:deazaflavin-dependent oxidoreductase (nitroreductase family)